jgi:hypothetical protein
MSSPALRPSPAQRAAVLFLVGAVGVGKSDASFRVFSRLWRDGVPTARLDLDDLGMCHPAPSDDVNNHAVKTALLAAAWPVFGSRGVERLVLSGGVETTALAELYRSRLPDADWTIVRLRTTDATRRSRVLHRGERLGSSTEENEFWIKTGREEEAALDADPLAEVVIDTDDLDREQVAALVLAAVGW